MTFVAKSTVVPESSSATICVDRNGPADRNYNLTLQPTAVAGGATRKTSFHY